MPIDEQRRQRFEWCIEREADALFRVAFRLMGCREAAADVVQETYLQAWNGLAQLRECDKMRGWLFAILRNQSLKRRRKWRREFALDSDNAPAMIETSADEATDRRDLVQFALNQLPDEQRWPLLLVTMEGWSVADAAEFLEIPNGTVLSRLHRGREKLRDVLTKQAATRAEQGGAR